MPGNYDPVRKVIYWGIANPSPYERLARHGGNPDGVSRTAPADLYSNCTVALDPETGKLIWYYQHLPADDWDTDHTHERTLLTTTFNPDPKAVKWYNTEVPRGSKHDIAAMVGESGIMFVLDRNDGKFLWAEPVPVDAPNLAISNIDGKTGATTINYDVVMKKPGDRHVICYWNGRSYWPTAYDPETNSLYTSYVDNCLDMTGTTTSGNRHGILREGSDINAIAGLAKINLSTGEMLKFDVQNAPGTGALLATAGGLIFHGDINRRFRAFDAATGNEALGIDPRRADFRQHRHIRGARKAVHHGDHRRQSRGAYAQPPERRQPDQRAQRDLYVRAELEGGCGVSDAFGWRDAVRACSETCCKRSSAKEGAARESYGGAEAPTP